jgi:dihydrofolate synthase/folylpolyglutamate synthase
VNLPAPRNTPPLDILLARLMSLHPRRIDLTLDRMWRVLDALGHPQRQIAPVIHVAGTNGKGSTVAFLRAILEAAGLAVHAYTSPHLVRINERFRIGRAGGGALVGDEELAEALSVCESANGDAPITVFEVETAAAFVLFARHSADIVLLEVGLGGRLDATNVIDRPLASVIAPIGMDHIEFLGDTLIKIATEKAGIIKPGAPVVVARQSPEAMAVIERQAQRVTAPIFAEGQEWTVTAESGRLVYQDERGLLDLPAPRLFGHHQFDNAGLAIAALRAAGVEELPAHAFESGIAKAEWPARMQRLGPGPLTALAPAGAEVWLDGGHNADGGRVAAAALADLEDRVPRPLVLIAGMLANKDCTAFLANFTGLTRHVVAVPVPDQEKGLPPERLAEAARQLGMRAAMAADVGEALRALAQLAYDVSPRILIIGSLYLAGAVLAANESAPQ